VVDEEDVGAAAVEVYMEEASSFSFRSSPAGRVEEDGATVER
jgi:hypothetical protein